MGCVFYSEQEYEYILLKQLQITQYFQCVFLKTVIGKDWEHSFIEPDLKHRISK